MPPDRVELTPVSTKLKDSNGQTVPELDDSPSSPMCSPDSPALSQTGWTSTSWPAAQLFVPKQGANASIDVGLHLTTEVLGRGSFSKVIKARGLHGVYAVKLLRKGMPGDLEDEARILQKLNDPGNPNVIRLLGRWNGGLVFPIYEGTLTSAVAEFSAQWAQKQTDLSFTFEDLNGPLCGRQRWHDWAKQLASGLAYVHSKHMVHGDLKPNNICYSPGRDRLVLTDFSTTVDDDAAFSLIYASPSLRAGQTPSPDSDMYALGVVLLFCATGTEPYGEAKNTQQRLLWMDKLVPQDSYSPEMCRHFANELPMLNELLSLTPVSATKFAADVANS
ncbi:Testis-specific serine/threonine-protein kinase 6 [Wickerhamiella sorbophila]|uniref:non-specific serine/threonine protein kinase n=1 Tax=Wickerhamiella sorbophila TaxID=45607 RepID=A0A2T0FGP3_9ASCO|nr:Testis-specific serine/threonine-protein kinase 6 [Wickerhamiella sorbophila]PRT54154.1 Testis-specific serine/threonine-protein kinase 6 [Wickerhamiella sorbophila]